jgi:hypothetical protein
MRIDRSHLPWALIVALTSAVCAVLYVANFFPARLPFSIRLPAFLGDAPPSRNTFGGTPLGLIFGSFAFAIFLFASALGIRKKKRLWPLGSVQLWLKAHIWLSVLTIPLVFFHCGFRFGGMHTSLLMILYGVVMISGFVGLALQQVLPRLMAERLSREVVFEQIPHLRAMLAEAAKARRASIVAAGPAVMAPAAPAGTPPGAEEPSIQVLAEFLDEECIPYLSVRRGERHRLGDERVAAEAFRVLRLNIDPKWKPETERWEGWCHERREMDLQTRMQHWLHGWLVVHVPVSFALLVFTAWHACVAVSLIVFPR